MEMFSVRSATWFLVVWTAQLYTWKSLETRTYNWVLTNMRSTSSIVESHPADITFSFSGKCTPNTTPTWKPTELNEINECSVFGGTYASFVTNPSEKKTKHDEWGFLSAFVQLVRCGITCGCVLVDNSVWVYTMGLEIKPTRANTRKIAAFFSFCIYDVHLNAENFKQDKEWWLLDS